MQPGEDGYIEVSVVIPGVMRLERSVVITTDHDQQRKIALSVKANVEPEIGLSQQAVYLGNVQKGRQIEAQILITISRLSAASIIAAASSDKSVSVKLSAVAGKNGKIFRLMLYHTATEVGYHFGRITLKTTSKLNPEIRIPVRGIVTAG